MCESCENGGFNRREFVAATGAIGALGLIPASILAAAEPASGMARIDKAPARVKVVFLYPPAEIVNAGKNEDNWAPHRWFTWPGNQFQPEAQEQTFTRKIKQMTEHMGLNVTFAPRPVYQDAGVREFIAETKASGFDAVLVINFWNTFAQWSYQIATESAPTAIVYQPVGSNHQLPPAILRNAGGIFYIHSIENWDEIERGLRAVHTRKMLAQSRLLRVTPKPPQRQTEQKFGVDVVSADAAEFNALFDAVKADDDLVRQAMAWKQSALGVMDVTDTYFVEAMRSHRAVEQIMQRYGADAITINCLMLEHRKPCLSFATNNGSLIPCGCENDFNATLTMMLGRLLFERAGFQHNPEFDTSRNQYFASHCTCATKLKGPAGPSQKYLVRPFFHQLPKTAALDVQWTPDEPVTLVKYNSADETITCWTGKVISSPTSPPTGGCATRVLVDIDKVEDICEIYSGPHPILYCADRAMARRVKVLSHMYNLKLVGNI
ncbi:MAG: hypothetical protein IH624_18000 [Phycisphaerae bacterium]|nr:hypothetical protein [Phycisphaerae bacterium]